MIAIEAESAINLSDVKVEKSLAGYTGGGYLNYGGKGASATIKLTASAAGVTTISLRYSNGDSKDRPLAVNINGVKVGTLKMASTGGWSKWSKSQVIVKVVAGANTLKLDASDDAGGPMLDAIEVGNVTVPTVPVEPMVRTRPEATTTGLSSPIAANIVLRPAPADFKPQSNTTYTGLQITGMVRLSNLVNVKFVACSVNANGNMRCFTIGGCKGIEITGCELYGATDEAVYGSGYTARYNHVHTIGGDGFKAFSDVVIEGNYVALLGWNNKLAHADGVQMPGNASNVVIRGNFFDMGRDVPNTKSNAAVFAQGNFTNITIDGNWCRGGNFTIHDYDDVGDDTSSVTNNVFYRGSSQYGFGQISSRIKWAGNKDENGVAVTARDK